MSLADGGRGVLEGRATFTLAHRAERALFLLVWAVLARWTPPGMARWRALILRAFGAEVGRGARVYGSARIWLPRNLTLGPGAVIGPRVTVYSMADIRLGAGAVVSQGAHLCCGSHDITSPGFELKTARIEIGPGAWVAAEAFVGPGVSMGEGAVLGARAVTFGDVPAWEVWAGNPAKRLKNRPREALPQVARDAAPGANG
ncbi:hypothetical protein [Halodurantibacterium flavum]|uniref:Acetyltransferase n=1 Tax=Halodurantibacterium flavum TaxID=1382802 RepID=A0ABW4S5E9_9RHOB